MATNKNTITVNTVEESKPYDPMLDKVPVTLPRATGKEENYIMVSLNGKNYQVMKGTTTYLPRPIADIIIESECRKDLQQRYLDDLREQSQRAASDAGLRR